MNATAQLTQLTAALAGRYAVGRVLGRGGMATVYAADDLRHRRPVAIKVLERELGAVLGPERFLREIEVTAALHHSHILPLHDSGEADGCLYYVMPLVEGETLRERLSRERQLAVDEALRIAVQAASALDYAHRHGIVHRDLKPENILLQDGEALVADFGIARAIAHAANADTLTATGVTLGTPHYMSPEQAAGERELDARTDVYSLGCVLYEMLSGAPPFTAPTAQGVVARVMTEEPVPVGRLRRAVPPHVEAAVSRALEKVPADRFASAAQFAAALSAPASATQTVPLQARAVRWRSVAWGALGLAAVVGAYGAALARTRENGALPVVAAITAPPGTQLQPASNASFSRDGARLAFVAADAQGRSAIWVRALDSVTATRVNGTEGATWPFWSPDGTSVGFFADAQLKIVSLRGGGPKALCPVSYPIGGAWMPNGTIVYAPVLFGPLYRVPASGGACTQFTTLRPGEMDHRRPSALPDGRVLFSSLRSNVALVTDLETSRITEVRRPGRDAQFVAPDRLLYFDEANGPLYTQRVDPKTLRLRGEPSILVDHVSTINGYFGRFAASRSALLFEPAPRPGSTMLVWVDRRSVVVDSLVAPTDAQTFAISGDGRRIVFTGFGMWVVDRARNVMTRLQVETASGQSTIDAMWDPGDSLISYQTRFVGVNTLRLYHLSTGTSDSLFAVARRVPLRPSWSPDGHRIAFTLRSGAVGSFEEPWIYSLDERRAWRVWEPKGNIAAPAWSPDGGWLAYESDETGAPEVYLRSLNGRDAPMRVSSAGGQVPRWRADGRALFFRAPDGSIMEVGVVQGRALGLSQPRVAVVGAPFSFAAANRSFAVSRDGQQFIAFARGDAPVYTLMLDWQDRLGRR